MLHNISWGQFLGWSSLAIVIYYVAIGALYYRQELASKLREGRKDRQRGGQSKPDQSTRQLVPGDSDDAEMPPAVDDKAEIQHDPICDHAVALMEDIDSMLYAAGKEGWTREQVVSSLQKKIRVNFHLQDTPLEQTVSRYVVRQVKEVMNIILDEHEVITLWQ